MLTFTLDTNCLIAIDEGRPEAAAVRALADAHAVGTAHVAVVAMSASERQQHGSYLHDFKDFRGRLIDLGLSHLDILEPMCYFDITFFDWCLFSDRHMVALESQIHEILFPNVEFIWQDYCCVTGLDQKSSPTGRWRNCKCDVQAIWSHIQNKRDVFVTSDGNFHISAKKAGLIALGAKQIECPHRAVSLI
jgi:hypothetical protein